mgnify:CR=1 FL=1
MRQSPLSRVKRKFGISITCSFFIAVPKSNSMRCSDDSDTGNLAHSNFVAVVFDGSEIIGKIDNGVINESNYKASLAKLKRMAK